MAIFKRIFLFLIINALVVLTISTILSLFNVQPYLTAYGLNYQSLMIFCFIWGMGGAFISLGLSRIMAKWMLGIKVVDPNTKDLEAATLVSIIYSLAKKAGLSEMPQIGIYQSKEVNAFATGPTKRRSLIAVSSGLLSKMNQNELEGVLAHEISHIANGDMVTMTLIQGIVNAFVMFLARVLAYALSGLGREKRENNSGGSYFGHMILVYVFEIVFMILGSIAIAWFSRLREYRADRGGAHLAGKEKMIAALQSLQAFVKQKDQKVEKPAFQAMKISSSNRSSFALLFSSHPPLEERIKRLRD